MEVTKMDSKEKAWQEFLANPDLVDVVDAFEWGWAKAIQSFTPHALPDPVPYKEIIDMTNEVLGKSFRVTEAHKKHIRARWNEGYRIEEFRRVCETKKEQWDSDPKWRPFLRPETLYGTKFDSYLNEEVLTHRKTTEEWM
jgi:uncharacterized phage protein (TIGR02220 family)